MGRGVSSGGGQSSLGYLFGSGESPKPAAESKQKLEPSTQKLEPSANNGSARKLTASQPIDISKQIPGSAHKLTASQPIDISKQIPAGICGDQANNYFRADGQNCGNFITDRPSTKVHAAPGGGSSLGYLFGDGGK